MNEIDLRLTYEDRACRWGFRNEVLNSLVADFLQGFESVTRKLGAALPPLPGGLHIAKPLREVFFEAGNKLANANDTLSDENLKNTVLMTLSKFTNAVKDAIKDNKVLASTGDCRGACRYNTGDSSEYRNYGW